MEADGRVSTAHLNQHTHLVDPQLHKQPPVLMPVLARKGLRARTRTCTRLMLAHGTVGTCASMRGRACTVLPNGALPASPHASGI